MSLCVCVYCAHLHPEGWGTMMTYNENVYVQISASGKNQCALFISNINIYRALNCWALCRFYSRYKLLMCELAYVGSFHLTESTVHVYGYLRFSACPVGCNEIHKKCDLNFKKKLKEGKKVSRAIFSNIWGFLIGFNIQHICALCSQKQSQSNFKD